jgi:DNA processing protein
MTKSSLPDQAYAATIAALPDMTPVRLRRLLRDRSAALVFEELLAGEPSLLDRLIETAASRPGHGLAERAAAAGERLRWWSAELSATPPGAVWARIDSAKVTVLREGDGGYPSRLGRLALPPELLYVKGDLPSADAACVGVVGTRRATHYGIGVASEFGGELASRGVAVVSGLALGIDAAAHGAAAGRARPGSGPIAVLGGGVDVVYPPRNRSLYSRVLERGAVVSEAPLGARPVSWRFPLRNRLIAALCDVLLVIESSRQGGSLHTVLAADEIGVPVLAVPGSIRSAQSEGTNLLISQGGAHPALDVADVLAALARVNSSSALRLFEPATVGTRDRGAPLSMDAERRERLLAGCQEEERRLYDLLSDEETHVDALCQVRGLSLREAVIALDRLSELGLVEPHGTGWVRR